MKRLLLPLFVLLLSGALAGCVGYGYRSSYVGAHGTYASTPLYGHPYFGDRYLVYPRHPTLHPPAWRHDRRIVIDRRPGRYVRHPFRGHDHRFHDRFGDRRHGDLRWGHRSGRDGRFDRTERWRGGDPPGRYGGDPRRGGTLRCIGGRC